MPRSFQSWERLAPWARPAPHAAARAASEAPRAARAADAPPVVTRGESPESPQILLEGGKAKAIVPRVGYAGNAAFIDWLNFTVGEESFQWEGADSPVTDDQMIMEVSVVLETIFGFGITARREKGANFYRYSFVLGDALGLVCFGGQRGTVLVSVSGEGCAAAKPDWEWRLKQWLECRAVRARLTRVDLAHDDYAGASYSVDRALADYRAGLMNCGGREPDVETRGNWERPNGKGRTLYVGNRKNGKFLRVYEKGRQLGDAGSEWVRVEVEFKGVDRVIPFDVLLSPGAYLAASYPALAWVSEEQERIKTVQRLAVSSYVRLKEWVRRQAGPALWVIKEVEGSAEAAFDLLVREVFPKSLQGSKSWANGPTPIHRGPPAMSPAGYELQFCR